VPQINNEARALPEMGPWLDERAARVPAVLSLKYIYRV
jgi:hypothetical protein